MLLVLDFKSHFVQNVKPLAELICDALYFIARDTSGKIHIPLIGAFSKLRNTTISFVIPVRVSILLSVGME